MALTLPPASTPPPRLLRRESSIPVPSDEVIKQRLLRKGVFPTPKILHSLRKKEIQKSLRRLKKHPAVEEASAEEEDALRLATARSEYRKLDAEISCRKASPGELAGKPWERSEGIGAATPLGVEGEGFHGGRLRGERLEELRKILEERNEEGFQWLLDDDVEQRSGNPSERKWARKVLPCEKRVVGDDEKIKLLIQRLTCTKLNPENSKMPKLIRQSCLEFSEINMLKIIEALGGLGNWKHAVAIVKWIYLQREYQYHKSRFVYTKLLAVLSKARRATEALHIYNLMRGDGQIYPDMAAYHVISVTLGQSGLVKELMNIIECMRKNPPEHVKHLKLRDWDPRLEPDVIVFNAVPNACVASRQWKGVYWVFNQIRIRGLKPIGATYGLAMEVMLKAGKYDLVNKYFVDMKQSGNALNALTYKVLVRAYWEQNKVDEAVQAVRDMEQSGLTGAASVYYEIACCLCNHGCWHDAILEVEKLKRLPLSKPLVVTFTGMILFAMYGGHIDHCISIFEQMKEHCSPNIGSINVMLKIYGRNDMLAKAKALFESIGALACYPEPDGSSVSSIKPDRFSYSSMLEASALAHQWEYFEYIYKEMTLRDFPLDQKKYSWLFVEASKAGKWHLLEHAFDAILEAGGVPHVSLFTEMICQTVSCQDFRRTTLLISGMAHASIQFDQNQWTYIPCFFIRNKDRFREDALLNLWSHLYSSELVMENPIPDLLNSLLSLQKPPQKLLEHLGEASACDVRDRNLSSHDLTVSKETSFLSSNALSGVAGYGRGTVVCGDADSSPDYEEGQGVPVADAMIDLLASHEDDPCSDLPSALSILEDWRGEDR